MIFSIAVYTKFNKDQNMAKNKMSTDVILEKFNEKVSSFSEEELNDLTVFFSNVYAERFIFSRDDAIDLLLNQGLPKALSKLSKEKQLEIKRKFLSL
jgi:hypothetical protein